MSTGIVQIRLSGEPGDATQLAASIAEIPGLTATGAGVRDNHKDPGVRGYLTVTLNEEMPGRNNQPAGSKGTSVMSTYGPQLPTLDDLAAATAATNAAIADHVFGREDIAPAAALEAATLVAYQQRPGAGAVLEAGS